MKHANDDLLVLVDLLVDLLIETSHDASARQKLAALAARLRTENEAIEQSYLALRASKSVHNPHIPF